MRAVLLFLSVVSLAPVGQCAQECSPEEVVRGSGTGLLQSQVHLDKVLASSESEFSVSGDACAPACLPGCTPSSRPGKPCIPPAKVWPYRTQTQWRTELGEQIVAAVQGTVPESACEKFKLFGDHVFCTGVMKRTDATALSYGIEQRDLWSETMSNHFHVSPWLYDCFADLATSPPMAGRAPNATGRGGCGRVGGHCYETAYHPRRVCLGAAEGLVQGRRYESLAGHLRGQGDLSVYLKMDVEGSEWTVLERLLQSEEDQAKLRTLDMEVHFGFPDSSDGGKPRGKDRASLEREVQILQGLLKRFACTGSTLEQYRQGWRPEENCPTQECAEPAVHTAGGFPVPQFAVSFVNRALL